MCAHVRVAPPDGAECLALARETCAYVTRRVHAEYPGVVDAIRHLHAQGYRLHTASGENSDDLEGYLQAMGVRDLFGRLYGADLVDTPKGSPLFFKRVFADAQVEPRMAVVVDDSELAVGWASEAGAVTILVSAEPAAAGAAHAVIRGLAALPALTQSIGA